MNTTKHISWIWLMALLMGLTSCYKLRIEVDQVPSNTPDGTQIYIAGNFNNWNPSDDRYALELSDDSTWYIDLPRGIGSIEYKFTRGDWTTVEKDDCGGEIDNRQLTYRSDVSVHTDTIRSWRDLDPVNCQWLIIVITSLPENTPADPFLVLAGNINDWEPEGEQYVFSYDSLSGKRMLRVHRRSDIQSLEFLITRGSLNRVEGDALGRERSPRRADFGLSDTVYVEVLSWPDLERDEGDFITLIVEDMPANTPPDDPIFYVGEINDWFPYQGSLRLERDRQGRYFIQLPRRAIGKAYKFTRGGWGKVEADRYGHDINNRVLRLEKSRSDTVRVRIEGWHDLRD